MYAATTGIIGWLTDACSKPPTSIFAPGDPDVMEACHKSVISGDFGPFIRGQPYLIGLLCGWILYKTKSNCSIYCVLIQCITYLNPQIF